MNISDNGLKFIESFEGFSPTAASDGFGYPTIGYGHKLVPGDGFDKNSKMTQQEATDYLRKDVQTYCQAVDKALPGKLNQNQFDACVSLCFNIGVGAFSKSSLVLYINEDKDLDEAAQRFLLWNKVRGKTVKGLNRRRNAEMKLFETPVQESVQPTNPSVIATIKRLVKVLETKL